MSESHKPNTTVVELPSALVVHAATLAIDDLKKLDVEHGQARLLHMWNALYRDYISKMEALDALSKNEQPQATSIKRQFSALVAFAVLDSYFEKRGDWDAMKAYVESIPNRTNTFEEESESS